MQFALDLGTSADLSWIRDRLDRHFGRQSEIGFRSPVGQLVKSSISSRTRDATSLAAYTRLIAAHPQWRDLAHADAGAIEALIGDVTFADVKACNLSRALRMIENERADFDLCFLADLPVDQALAWLERLPGVGRKVAASTLNFSTLRMPAFVVDTHILRVLHRWGMVRSGTDTCQAYALAMGAAGNWNANELARLHVQIKRLGQEVCQHHAPACARCPLETRCRAVRARQRVAERRVIGLTSW